MNENAHPLNARVQDLEARLHCAERLLARMAGYIEARFDTHIRINDTGAVQATMPLARRSANRPAHLRPVK